MMRVPLRTWAFLISAGAAQACAMAWPLTGSHQGQAMGWLQLLSLALFAALLDRCTHAKQAFMRSWLFASSWLLASTWWLYISMHQYGGMPAWMAALAVAALGVGVALFYAVAGWTYFRVAQSMANRWARALVFSAVWLLAELTRGNLWTGFPWAAAGYGHVDGVLRHLAPWVGVYGLSAIAAWVAMALAAQRRAPRDATTWRSRWFSGLLLVLLLLGWTRSPSRQAPDAAVLGEPMTVTLLQGNVPQDMKFGAGMRQALNTYREALLNNPSDLIVTPETAIPLLSDRLPEGYWAPIQDRYAQGEQAALIGLPAAIVNRVTGERQYTNAAMGLVPGAEDGYRYDKHHLVPFGEFVPPMFQWFVRLMNIPLGDFARGAVAQPSLSWRGERIAPNICFEDLFGEELAQSFADPASAPTVLVNLSNIAWFGDTVVVAQHLNISRMRTLELGRPMLRATNTGATAIIDARGVVTHRLPSGIQGALTAQVRGVHGDVTPYAAWAAAWGLWPLVVWALAVLAVLSGSHKRRARHPLHQS